MSTVERGWQPLVALAGARDAARAVKVLRELSRLWSTVLHHSEVDAATRDLVKRATSSLHDFNLQRLYELLPDKDGRFRALLVSGERVGSRYLLSKKKLGHAEVGPSGHRRQLGDASLVLRAAPVTVRDGDKNFLLQVRAGMVTGQIDWPMMVDGAQHFLRLIAGSAQPESSDAPLARSRQQVLEHNPKLGPEDLEPLATLWEAFPRFAELLRSLGGIDDLLDTRYPSSSGAVRLRAVLHLDPERVEARYPELAEYMADLGKLFEADLRWLDAQNRTLGVLHLDSRTLSATLELYQRDGLLVPSRRDQALTDQPVQAGPGVYPYTMRASVYGRALGLRVQLRDIQVSFEHDRGERGLSLRGRMTHKPTATVTGAALGFIPPAVIDVLIPGDIQGLIEKSLTTACKGNDGKGAELDVSVDRQRGELAALHGRFGVEVIDNFLVKLGVSHFSDHIMPDEDVRGDIARLLSDSQRAFAADLARYVSLHASETPRP